MKRNSPNRLGLPGGGHLGANESSPAKSPSLVTRLDCWLVRRLMTMTGHAPIAIKLWNGEIVYRPLPEPVATLTIRDRGTLLGLLLSPRFAFGDAYSTGHLAVRGNLVECLEAAYRGLNTVMPPGSLRSKIGNWLRPPRSTSLRSARRNIQHHYDLGNDFYRLWLDEGMVYTCAYYDSPDASLEEAQIAKMDHVCRKLELKPGQSVVEAGCGWGALALHMARRYGVRVRAFNISSEQTRHARGRARAEGLEGQVEFVEDDYRCIRGDFDAFVSVGMLEHVGVDNFEAFGAVIHNALRPGGRGLVHSIGRNRPMPNDPWIERRIFPGSRPPSLSEMMRVLEPFSFSVLDVENLRLHYARTCAAWLERFEGVAGQVESIYGPNFTRAWRLYLAGSAASFAVGNLQLFQVVFARSDDNAVPSTRDHIYTCA